MKSYPTQAALVVDAYIRAKSLSPNKLGKKIGLTGQTIRRIIAGESVTAATLAKLRTVRGLGSLRPEDFGNGASR